MSDAMETGTPCGTPRRVVLPQEPAKPEEKEEKGMSLDDEEVKQAVLKMTVGAKVDEGKTVAVIEWPKDRCMKCKLLAGCFDDPKEMVNEVTLEHVKPYALLLAGAYFEFHKKAAPRPVINPITSSELKDMFDPWDCEFVTKVKSVSDDAIFDLMLAANYLGADDLLTLCVTTVATMVRNKSADQIHKAFNILSDYTPAEEEEVRKKHGHLLE